MDAEPSEVREGAELEISRSPAAAGITGILKKLFPDGSGGERPERRRRASDCAGALQ